MKSVRRYSPSSKGGLVLEKRLVYVKFWWEALRLQLARRLA